MSHLGHLLDGRPNYINDAQCQHCGRIYLPVLLVRPSVADARHASVLAQATHLYDRTPDATGRNVDPDRPWKRQSILCAGYLREWLRQSSRENVQAHRERGAFKAAP